MWVSVITELWKRDDGWTVEVTIDGDEVKTDHIPLTNWAVPFPLTHEYMVRVLEVHGYSLEWRKE